MKILVSILCLGLLTPSSSWAVQCKHHPWFAPSEQATAESYEDLSREYNQVYQEFLRKKIEKFPKGAMVEVFLNDGTDMKGTFESFSKYDDEIWIMPLGKRGFFADEVYCIRELQDISILVLRSI